MVWTLVEGRNYRGRKDFEEIQYLATKHNLLLLSDTFSYLQTILLHIDSKILLAVSHRPNGRFISRLHCTISFPWCVTLTFLPFSVSLANTEQYFLIGLTSHTLFLNRLAHQAIAAVLASYLAHWRTKLRIWEPTFEPQPEYEDLNEFSMLSKVRCLS